MLQRGILGLLLATLVVWASGCFPPNFGKTITVTVTTTAAPTTVTQTLAPSPTSSQSQPLSELPSVAEVVAKVSPSVVFIHTKWIEPGFFWRPPTQRTAAGSGVIVTSDGFILTNHHVIDNAEEITVTLVDGTSFEATLWGSDALTDLAVLKVEASGLPAATFGDSTKMRPGDWVIAIGNALDLPGNLTVSLGIISALNRTVLVENRYLYDLLQTDAAINEGNSGGPLVNLDGEVVGINTAIAKGAEGIGFAISSTDTAIPVRDQLIQNRRVIWPWMGISALTLTPSLAADVGLSVTEGVLIYRVWAGTPAADAGLQKNDVIVALDGETITSRDQLIKTIRSHKVGDEIRVTIVRDGETLVVPLKLAEMPRQ